MQHAMGMYNNNSKQQAGCLTVPTKDAHTLVFWTCVNILPYVAKGTLWVWVS